MKYNFQKGFTLIELMIVVAIVAILAATAINYYGDSVHKSRCTEGRSALLTGASTLEKCKSIYGVFDNANCNTAVFLGNTADNHFNVTMARTANTFTLTATGIGAATATNGNQYCSIITLNHLGVQGGTGSAPW